MNIPNINLEQSPITRSSRPSSCKNQSILKKSPSRSNKNVKFSPKVNINCFFSHPNEKNHEILINRHSSFDQTDSSLFKDEILWSNAQKGILYKKDDLKSELAQIEAEILLLTKENKEISSLVINEQEDFKKAGYKEVQDIEIDRLIIKNRSLQELINEKTLENDGLKARIIQSNKNLEDNIENRIFDIEKSNSLLEGKVLSLKNQYNEEIKRFSFVSKGLFDKEDETKALERELDRREREIEETYSLIKRIDGLLELERGFRSNKIGLETIILICAEFERLEAILKERRKENY